ncbi:DUF805 domain-containing protein [Alistipes sp.]|uniref:DUF805 domain-containing protein n=1 Tax=Alistipes sp. TaxID=1872444 RepID=UPI003AF1AD04
MKWFVKCIKNYVNFKGRARRAEYWYFVLFSAIFMLVATLLDALVGSTRHIFYGLLGLFLILPSLAVQVRRLHDTNRSGMRLLWMLLAYVLWIVLLFVFGLGAFISGGGASTSTIFLLLLGVGGVGFLVWGILFLVWYCTAGTEGENKYGPDPKAEA